MNPMIAKNIIPVLKEISYNFKNNSVVMQFIPIMLILGYTTYRHEFVKLSYSILGKLFAVMLIFYYTRIDFIYGTICCILVILYYQQTEIEGFSMEEETKEKDKKEEDKKEEEVTDDGTNLPLEEGFETFEPPIITIDQFNAAKDEFIKEKCKNGVLMYKDFPVKSEMADHVYSEIQFDGKSKCNPCDRTCDYNIIEAKLETEKKLIPKISNDIFDAFANIFNQ
jgi:hypothetical protein